MITKDEAYQAIRLIKHNFQKVFPDVEDVYVILRNMKQKLEQKNKAYQAVEEIRVRFQQIFPDVKIKLDNDETLSYKETYTLYPSHPSREFTERQLSASFVCLKDNEEVSFFRYYYLTFNEEFEEVFKELVESIQELEPKYNIGDIVQFTEDCKDEDLSDKTCEGKILERFISCESVLTANYYYKIQDLMTKEVFFISEDDLFINDKFKTFEIVKLIEVIKLTNQDNFDIYDKILEILKK